MQRGAYIAASPRSQQFRVASLTFRIQNERGAHIATSPRTQQFRLTSLTFRIMNAARGQHRHIAALTAIQARFADIQNSE
jgi:hypothetical protein